MFSRIAIPLFCLFPVTPGLSARAGDIPNILWIVAEDYNFQTLAPIYDGSDWSQRPAGKPFFAPILEEMGREIGARTEVLSGEKYLWKGRRKSEIPFSG